MSTTVLSLRINASVLLQDTANVRWSPDNLLIWLNEGQRELVLLKPNAYVKSSSTILVAGTKQSLPTDGIYLIDIPRNLGTTGSTPTYSIKVISREVLDNQVADWHHSKYANARVKHFVYNEDDPKRFYVYPAQPTSGFGYVEIVYAAVPTDAVEGGNIVVPDEYAGALLNYICYRAWTMDSEWAQNKVLADSYYEHFVMLVTGKTKGEADSSPNKGLAPSGQQGSNK